MSIKYDDAKKVPTNELIARLIELSNSVAKHNMSDFTMSIPVQVHRDADVVLLEAARRLEFMHSYGGRITRAMRILDGKA